LKVRKDLLFLFFVKLIFMKKIINTPDAPAAIGPYSQAIQVNGTLYISGQLPINPQNGKIETDDIQKQTDQVFKNILAILKAAGLSMENVVLNRVYLSDIGHFQAMNEVYAKYFTSHFPARAAFAVKDLPRGALVEIETIAEETGSRVPGYEVRGYGGVQIVNH
jgi:2-iminobutanoate/2-iminopropanoate deaminase